MVTRFINAWVILLSLNDNGSVYLDTRRKNSLHSSVGLLERKRKHMTSSIPLFHQPPCLAPQQLRDGDALKRRPDMDTDKVSFLSLFDPLRMYLINKCISNVNLVALDLGLDLARVLCSRS